MSFPATLATNELSKKLLTLVRILLFFLILAFVFATFAFLHVLRWLALFVSQSDCKVTIIKFATYIYCSCVATSQLLLKAWS